MFEKEVEDAIENLRAKIDKFRGTPFGKYHAEVEPKRISDLQTIYEFVKNPDSHKKLIRLKRLQVELDSRYPMRVKQSTAFVEFSPSLGRFDVNFELKPANKFFHALWSKTYFPTYRASIYASDVTNLDEQLGVLESERATRKEKRRAKRLAIRESRRSHQSTKGK